MSNLVNPVKAFKLKKKKHRLYKPVLLLLRYSLNFRDDFLRNILRRLIISLEVHC
jgi:hypothetical protein